MLSMDSATYSVCGLRCVENTNQSALCEGEKKKVRKSQKLDRLVSLLHCIHRFEVSMRLVWNKVGEL